MEIDSNEDSTLASKKITYTKDRVQAKLKFTTGLITKDR